MGLLIQKLSLTYRFVSATMALFDFRSIGRRILVQQAAVLLSVITLLNAQEINSVENITHDISDTTKNLSAQTTSIHFRSGQNVTPGFLPPTGLLTLSLDNLLCRGNSRLLIFSVPQNRRGMHITISAFSLTDRLLAVIVDDTYLGGTYTVNFDSEYRLAAGPVVLLIKTPDRILSRQFFLK